MPDTTPRLRAALAGDAPAGVAALDTASQDTLAALVEDARRRQAQSLQKAFVDALKYVPFPVRGVVKKVLLG